MEKWTLVVDGMFESKEIIKSNQSAYQQMYR
jgi:hypothetical protein